MKPSKTGLARILNAFVYSWHGFIDTIKTEAAFRQELLLFVFLTPIALFIQVTPVERVLLFGSMLLVLLMELANTAIEAVIDRISPDIHPLSKKAKDIGSLLVLVSFINLVLTWLLILIPALQS